MNPRKFTLFTSAIIMFFLFFAGIYTLSCMNKSTVKKAGNGINTSAFGSIFSDIIQTQKPVNILVLGGDKVNNNTDTIMLVNYDPSTTKANVVSIPRDTKVSIENKVRKINFAYPHAGAKLAVETVSGLLQANIKYYVYIDTSVFRKIIDKLGGIKDFNVPEDLDYDDPAQDLHIHLDKGVQDLDGAKAEQYMRFRKYNSNRATRNSENYDGSDLKRITAQQSLLKELVRQKANLAHIHQFNEIVQDIFNSLETNMKLSEVLSMAQNITEFKYENISFFTLPGVPRDEGASYYILDSKKTDEMIKQYFTAEEGFDGGESIIGNSERYRIEDSNVNKSENATKKVSKKNSYTKNNPSNSETNIKKSQKAKP